MPPELLQPILYRRPLTARTCAGEEPKELLESPRGTPLRQGIPGAEGEGAGRWSTVKQLPARGRSSAPFGSFRSVPLLDGSGGAARARRRPGPPARGPGRRFVMTRGARGRRGNTFDLSAVGARPAAHAAPAPHEMPSCKASNH